MKWRARRLWSDEEKRWIVAQTYTRGVLVSQIGRRCDVNGHLIFMWRRAVPATGRRR